MKRTGDAWSLNYAEKVEEGGKLYSERMFYSVDDYLAWTKSNPGRKK